MSNALPADHGLAKGKCLHGMSMAEHCPSCASPARAIPEQAAPKAEPDAIMKLRSAYEKLEAAQCCQEDGMQGAYRIIMAAEKELAGAVRALLATQSPVPAALATPPTGVEGDWRIHAAAWLRSKADEQEAINLKYPRHVACYPSWEKKVRDLRWLADELFVGAAAQPVAGHQGGDKP